MRKNFVRRYRLRFGPRRNLKVLEEVATDIVKENSQDVKERITFHPEEEDKFEESEQLYKNEPAEAVLNTGWQVIICKTILILSHKVRRTSRQ